jgi:hypothetical protein
LVSTHRNPYANSSGEDYNWFAKKCEHGLGGSKRKRSRVMLGLPDKFYDHIRYEQVLDAFEQAIRRILLLNQKMCITADYII